MHHEDIKAALRKRGYTITRVAREMGLHQSTISTAIRPGRRSRPVEKKIADILGRPVEKVWPERYPTAA